MWLFSMCSSSSSISAEEQNGDTERSRTLLYLNVYDVTRINNCLYWLGLGIFHSGIEVHGFEYSFGSHKYSFSGMFKVKPRSCPGYTFRRSILLGSTEMTRAEFHSFMDCISRKYGGNTYHLTTRNCNHFSDEVCMQLTGKPIPAWVNRLARIGSFCNCLLPESIQIPTVTNLPDDQTSSDDESDSVDSSSIGSSSDEELDHHFLTLTDCDVPFLEEKPLRLAKELL